MPTLYGKRRGLNSYFVTVPNQDLRIRYLYPFNEPNNQSFIRIMSNDESSSIHNLSLFFYHAFKRRNNYLIMLPDTM